MNIKKKYLIEDYVIKGEKILCVSSGRLIRNMSINNLNLSPLAYKFACRSNIKSMKNPNIVPLISDIMRLTPQKLKNVCNYEIKIEDEIM